MLTFSPSTSSRTVNRFLCPSATDHLSPSLNAKGSKHSREAYEIGPQGTLSAQPLPTLNGTEGLNTLLWYSPARRSCGYSGRGRDSLACSCSAPSAPQELSAK